MLDESKVIVKSKYSKDTRLKELLVSEDKYSQSGLISVINRTSNLTKNWENYTFDELIDLLEVLKTTVAIQLRLHGDEMIDISNIDLTFAEKAQGFKEIFGSKLRAKNSARFVQTGILAELRGYVSKMSRNKFVLRCAVQGVNGSHSKLLYIPRESKQISVPKHVNSSQLSLPPAEFVKNYSNTEELKYYSHQFAFIFPKLRLANIGETKPALDISKSTGTERVNLRSTKIFEEQTYRVCSSYYQTQFLDWFLFPPQNNPNVDIGIQGDFLMSEIECNAVWDLKTKKVKLTEGNARAFVSIPFSLSPNITRANYPVVDRYLGVDIGEYGLAWCVIDSQSGINVIDKGFIRDQQLRKIANAVLTLKETQVTGTFSIASTKVARLRESAATSLRNRLHQLALRYKAKLVYELQVSHFETGGNKIKKLYATLKKSDVYAGTDADKLYRQQIWGKRRPKGSINIGMEVSAVATSQLCSKCKRRAVSSFFNLGGEKRSGKYKLLATTTHNIYKINVGEKSFLIYLEGQNADNEVDVDTILKGLYAFMRPPITSAVVDHCRIVPPMNYASQRGNSALFVCPFTDCLHVSDADIQAALNIAVKGYLKDKYKLDKDKESIYHDVQWQEEVRMLNSYPVIELN